MSGQDYQPHLLRPGTAGIPAHIRVSHDSRVYQEFADPAVTAVVYVPQWSQGVCTVFNQQAAARYASQPEYSKEIDHRIGADATEKPLLELLKAGVIEHLHNQLFRRTDSAALINELAEQQLEFLEAVGQQTNKAQVHVRYQVVDFVADAFSGFHMYQPREYVHQPLLPHLSRAHTDMNDTGLFSNPVGTILVDQDGLDIKGLRKSMGGTTYIPVHDLANRLWQIPDASFALWRGEGTDSAQYHIIPAVERNLRRTRLFGYT